MKNHLLIAWLIGISFSCNYEETPVKNSDVIRGLTFEQPYLEADGFARTKVMIEIPANADSSNRTVEISTTVGTFAETDKKSTVSIIAEPIETSLPYRLIAQATLVSPLIEGDATVTARIAGHVQTKPYSFTTAYPEALTITPDHLTLKSGFDNEVKFTILLIRKKGIPSLNRPVQLVVKDSTGKKIGRFREQLYQSDSNGKCYFTYTMGTESYVGKLTVQATTDKQISVTDTIYATK